MQPRRNWRPAVAIAVAAVAVLALTACSRFISHEAGSAPYDSTQQSGSATFTQSHPTSDPAAYEGSRVAKVHIGASNDPSHARGVINLQPANNYGKYGAAIYFPPGTLNGTDPKQQVDIDVLRWDYGSDAEFGGIRIGSDHRARLIKGQSGQPVQSIGDPFNLHEGCWNWLVVNQRLNLPHPDAPPPFSEVYLNGSKVIDSQAANGFGHSAEKVRFGAVSVAGGTTQEFDFFIDQSFISNDAMPPPTGNACDPDWGGSSEPSTIPQSVQTPLSAATSFLYTGDDPIQQGVAPGTIEEQRAAVLRGRVRDREGEPLGGVRVTLVGHPEFGYTETRPDGSYQMAVNGGGNMRLRFERDDHLPVERELDVPWQQYSHVDDVVLTPIDAQMTEIDLSPTTESIQVARGTPVDAEMDPDGSRQATLLFPAGTTATMTLPDNSQQPLPDARVRATEYTVGERGPEAMPAELPPTSGYTYAVDYTVDEALAADATKVTFDPAAISYTDNFVGFPVGEDVPAGYYDRAKGAWVPSDSGRVIKIRSESGGIAELEVTDSGEAATPAELAELGITDSERVKLAQLYDAPKTLWRVRVEHFTPWDLNWGLVPPDDVIPPGQTPLPKIHGIDQDCPEIGSVIECEDQVLGETLPLTGSDLSLNYRSDRTPGHRAAYRIEIPLDVPLQNGNPHPNLDRIEVRVEVAGQRFRETFESGTPTAPTAGQSHPFVWNGKDAFGRTLQGRHEAKISLGHTYEAEYGTTSRFGYNGGGQRITGSRIPREVTLWSDRTVELGAWDARSQGLGGWTLDAHHVYDTNSETLHLGDGTRRSAEDVSRVVNTRAGGGPDSGEGVLARNADISGTAGVAAAPDGGYYLSEVNRHRVRRVSPEGLITTVAGTGEAGSSGDEGPAGSARLRAPWGLKVGPDGSLYIADKHDHRIRRVYPDGVIRTVAGDGAQGNDGDGGLATEAGLNQPTDVAVAADGSLYIASLDRVRRVDPAGRISTVFTPTPGFAGLFNIWGIDVATDGTVYFSDNRTIKRLAVDGSTAIVAGQMDLPDDTGEGGPATEAKIWATGDVLAQADGSFYFSDRNNNKIKYVSPDGIITTVAGTGSGAGSMGPSPDGTPARKALVNHPAGLALGAGGGLLVAVGTTDRILGVSSPLPGFSGEEIAIPSEDGRELYQFDGRGRHLRTLDTLTGAELYRFEYTAAGALQKVHDGDQNMTEILRDSGEPTAIVAPFGHLTTVALESDGFLAFARNPMLQTFDLDYDDDPDLQGLLNVVADPKGQVANYVYHAETGRLTEAQDRADGFKTLTRTSTPNSSDTTLTTRLGRSTKYRVENQSNGDVTRTHTDPAGLQSTLEVRQDGTREATSVDETVTKTERAPDPRFGMQASVLKDLELKTPDGRTLTLVGSREVTPPSGDPLALQTQTDTLSVNGRQYTTAYDASADRFETTTPQNRTATTAIDDQGRPTRAEATELHPVATTYLGDGRLDTEKQGPENDPTKQRLWQYTYEPGSGFLETVTDPMNRVTSFDYDPAGRVTGQVLPGNRQIGFGYDANGNLTSITPPSRPAHVFDHNAVDLVRTYDPPTLPGFTPTTTYAYNHDQDVEKITRPDGREVTFNYELTTRRLASFDQPRGLTDLDYHPVTGNVSSITAPGGEAIALAYDGALPEKETYSGTVTGSASRTYDDDLRIASTSVNDAHTIDYTYDGDSLLEQAEALDLHRDAESGLLTGSTLASTDTTIAPNGFGEPDSISHRFGTQTLYSATYVRDNAGRITQKTETTSQGTYVYSYDYFADTGFLKSVTRDGDPIAEYTYDSNGNRLTGPGVTTPADYDDQDRLESYGNAVYAYNEGGELETKTVGSEVTQYDYDALGSLENVTLPDGTLIDYVTDGYGRRIAKKRGTTVEQRFIYGEEALGPVAELNSDGSVRSRFIYATRSNVPDYMTRNGTTYRFVLDHLGSPRTIVDASTGEVVQEMDYDEYGKVIRDTQPGFQPFGFAGGLYDADTGLVLFGARDYDADTGRWTARDPIGFSGEDSNLYGYVLNDPINFGDPTGLFKLSDITPAPLDGAADNVENAAKSAGEFASNAAAGGLNTFTGGLSNRIAGVDGSCAGSGYGLGETLGSLNPRSLVQNLVRGGVKRFARQKGRTRGGGQRLGGGDDPLYLEDSVRLNDMLRDPRVSKAEKQKVKRILKGRQDRPSSETK